MRKEALKLVFPRAEKYQERPRVEGPQALTDLTDKVVAFLDDGRPNASVALASIREEMERAFQVRPVTVEQKAFGLTAADPLPKDVFERLVKEVDAVVVGIAS